MSPGIHDCPAHRCLTGRLKNKATWKQLPQTLSSGIQIWIGTAQIPCQINDLIVTRSGFFRRALEWQRTEKHCSRVNFEAIRTLGELFTAKYLGCLVLRPVVVRLLDFTLDLIEAQQAIYEMGPEICEAYTQYIHIPPRMDSNKHWIKPVFVLIKKIWLQFQSGNNERSYDTWQALGFDGQLRVHKYQAIDLVNTVSGSELIPLEALKATQSRYWKRRAFMLWHWRSAVGQKRHRSRGLIGSE